MMNFMRKYLKAILWLLIASFVIWGASVSLTSRQQSQRRAKYAGKIFGRKISFQEFDKARTQVQIETFLSAEDPSKLEKMDINAETWQWLIFLEEAKREKIKVDNEEIVETIYKYFQRDGKFQEQQYQYFVRKTLRITPPLFEDYIRNSIKVFKLRKKIFDEVSPTDKEIEQEFIKENQEAEISYVLFKKKDVKETIEFDEEILHQYYRDNPNPFRVPEKVNIEYLYFAVEPDKVIDTITDAQISEYYQNNQDQFKIKDDQGNEKVRPFEETAGEIKQRLANEKARADAESLAQKIHTLLLADPDFDTVKDQYDLTKKQTGFFSQKASLIPTLGFAPYFASTAFSLKEDEVSQPVYTMTGYCILRLLEKKPGYIPAFADVRGDVEVHYIDTKADEKIKQRAEEILKKIIAQKQAGKTFEQAAQEQGLKVEKTDYFKRSGMIPGLGFSEELTNAAFLLKKGEIAKQVISVPDGYVIVRMDEFKDINKEEIGKGFEEFKKQYLATKRMMHFFQWMQDLQTRANVQKNI